ncbi:hypothetical protein V3C99_015535 [Haemonchus contortus]|uniref:RNA helicase n=1 Tax=Haemonchus contortus TaxID=6289 RepID=A0A7I4YXA0_HAECO|nr:DNA RNA helicase and Helicase-associated region and Domain of unknown function DUF1605 domain containing protein [Haemonchus contortus]
MKEKRTIRVSTNKGQMPPQKKMREHNLVIPRLPIHDVEFQIMEALHSHETVVLIGETGCGKSTQVPQFCVRIGLARKGRIGVTQPRRLAAVSLASRVSEELNSPLGREVGYHVRFERELSEETKIVFLTDGILLREAIHDPLLRDYSTILVDEAHERSLHTDILLNVLRLCQRQRKETDMLPLRIVIMSATLEAELFSKFFNDAPVFVVKGRTFPVEIYHAELNPDNADYVYNALVCIKDLHQEEPLSDHFLVFLTGREEIEGAAKKLKELNEHFTSPIFPVPLFAAMSSVAQMRAFEPPPEGHRKVVLATNIAETSLTIPGVRVVIDSGKVKTRSFTAANRVDVLRIHDISKAQAIQRAGRAGREAPGKCYRLYPFRHFERLEATSVPEVLRSNLATVLLEMLALGLRRPRKLKLIQQPEEESMIAAERELLALGAATVNGKEMVLTPIGRTLCKFPLSPDQARVLIIANELACMEEALTIIASMYCETVFEQDGYNDSQDIDRIRARFASNESDHLTVMNVVQAFKQEKQKNAQHLKEWCSHNHLNFKNLTMVLKVRKQLREIAVECGMKMISCGAQREKARQALACGLFMNACEYSRQEDRYRLLVKPSTTLKIHPSSRLCRSRPRHIVFTDLVKTTDLYARDVSIIDYEWVQPALEEYRKNVKTYA